MVNKYNKHKAIKRITVDAMFIAIIIIMTFVPYVGFISIPPISFTLMHIPVLVGACLMGWKRGLFYGIVFGICSLIKSLTATGTLDPYFIYPWISILPRAIFGLLAGMTFDLLRNIKKFSIKSIAVGIASGILTMVHTLLVFLALFAFGFNGISNALATQNLTWILLLGTFCTGGAVEAAVATVIVPSISFLLNRFFPNLFLKRKEYTNETNEL